jgi:hypothetical protein
MAKRVFLSCFLALVACGVFFYLVCFAGLMYTDVIGPLNPPNDSGLQWVLRHVALPVSIVLGALVFRFAFRRFGNQTNLLK